MARNVTGSYFLFGPYGNGKTHLASAQYRTLVEREHDAGWMSMADLLAELRRAELDADYFSVVRDRIQHVQNFHLHLDDVDKHRPSDFRFEALFGLFDQIYSRDVGLTVTSNYNLEDLVEFEKLHPAIVRRIEDMCVSLEV